MKEIHFKDGRFKPIEGSGAVAHEDKAGRYGWNTDFGQRGKMKEINKKELRVDDSYQRAQSLDKARRIAREFAWVRFACLIVSERKNGTFFVLEGGHRALAVMMRPEIQNVPCLVWTGLTIAQEADAFIYYNAHRKAPTGIEIFAAAITAKRDLETKLGRLLEQNEIRVANDKTDSDSCASPRLLTKLYTQDPDRLDAVLKFLNAVWPDEAARLQQESIGGAFRFDSLLRGALGHGVEHESVVARFKKVGLSAIRQKANGIREIAGKSKPDSFSLAMIEAWNYQRKSGRIDPTKGLS